MLEDVAVGIDEAKRGGCGARHERDLPFVTFVSYSRRSCRSTRARQELDKRRAK
jgi:hypothetical protein